MEEQDVRIQKMHALREKGVEPFPSYSARGRTTCYDARMLFEGLSQNEEVITLVGRIRSKRIHGGSAFLDLHDATERMQLFFSKGVVGEEVFEELKERIDLGDFIEVKGTAFLTQKGEKTLSVQGMRFLAKTLLPLPEKWHGLSDVEIRYRQRYLDLLANPEVRDIFAKRATIIQTIRTFFEAHGFTEVDTPMLQPIPGGATARPFITHHNALDTDLYLRVAPELYLKRLIVGGYERVFEIARCFRNEGIDHTHNPEFTQVEAYMAYADYIDLMAMMEELIVSLVQTIHKSDRFTYQEKEIVCSAPFARMTFRNALQEYGNIDIDEYLTFESLATWAKEKGMKVESAGGRGRLLDDMFKKFVTPHLLHPTFIVDYPLELSPLAKKKADNPRYTERFQLVIAHTERVNAFSELNDPIDQRERFEEQQKHHLAGDEEAHRVDGDFLTALEHGMPPTAGLGMGIDRLVALLTDSHSLKEVIFFPTLRPKTEDTAE